MSVLPAFDAVVAKITERPPGSFVAVAPYSDIAISAVAAAIRNGAPKAYLTGAQAKIREAVLSVGLDPAYVEIRATDDDDEAVAVAVDLVARGEAEFVVKGSLPTSQLLRGLLSRKALGQGGLASHVYIIEAPAFAGRTVVVTDAGVNIAPGIEDKAAIVRNTCRMLRTLGVDRPRVAALSAIETVNNALPSSLDAACLTMMARRGQLGEVELDGPLSLDAAMMPAAARSKGLAGEVAGQAEVLLAPGLDAANMYSKALIGSIGRAMGVIVGAAVPIALPSRGDSLETRINSTLLAGYLAASHSGRPQLVGAGNRV